LQYEDRSATGYQFAGRRKMSPNKRYLVLITTTSLLLVGWLFVQAPAPVVQAGKTLPPRSPSTPAAGDQDSDRDSDPIGAYIQLQAVNPPSGSWSVVQWKDSAGNWHDVPGWRGQLEARGQVRWWVAAKDFGTGPFRWSVMRGHEGPLLGSSRPFDLPGNANETLQIVVSLGTPDDEE
jgi:hypothetical protein